MFDDNVDNNLHTEPKKQTSPELFLCLNLLWTSFPQAYSYIMNQKLYFNFRYLRCTTERGH
jgi:hypothetical protein